MERVKLLDGSMGEELADRGFGSYGGLWSAHALVYHPNEVKKLHLDYLRCGARFITSNTYSTIPSYLEKEGFTGRMDELVMLAGRLAREAADEYSEDACVLGCLPPLDESYRPDRVPDRSSSIPVYRQIARTLAPYVDVFLAETMSSATEAETVALSIRDDSTLSDSELILALTVSDSVQGSLRSGESVADTIELLSRFEPKAILFNCSSPWSILSAIQRAKECTDIPIGGYPNRFQEVADDWTLDGEPSIERNESLTPDSMVEWVERFVEEGAVYVGGCCGIGPQFIQKLAERFNTSE